MERLWDEEEEDPVEDGAGGEGPEFEPVIWAPGERRVRDFGKGIGTTLLRGLSALNLPLERQQLWSELVPARELPQGHMASIHTIGGVLTRVQLDLADYGDSLGIVGVAYGLPGEGHGGWMGSCIPRGVLVKAVHLVLEARAKERARENALFPDLV